LRRPAATEEWYGGSSSVRRVTAQKLSQILKKRIIQENKGWLGRVIDLRDKMNHYVDGGLGLENFTVFVRKIDGVDTLYTPKLSVDQTVRDLMSNLFTNLIDFLPHFTSLSTSCVWLCCPAYASGEGCQADVFCVAARSPYQAVELQGKNPTVAVRFGGSANDANE
jgi:hypothetical protein